MNWTPKLAGYFNVKCMKINIIIVIHTLGAGASIPYRFPSGQELREIILAQTLSLTIDFLCHKYNIRPSSTTPTEKEKKIYKKYLKPKLDNIKYFIDTYSQSPGNSIDQFLSIKRENAEIVRIGKNSIVMHILYAEMVSPFNTKKDIILKEKKYTPLPLVSETLDGNILKRRVQGFYSDWYTDLFNKIIDGISFLKDPTLLEKNNIRFTTFNYDRSLETFFYLSLKNLFDLDDAEISAFLKDKICHVYGKIDELPWQCEDPEERKKKKPYGAELDYDYIEKCTENIRLIHDRKHDKADLPEEVASAHEWLHKADKVYFLGFGYARENLKALDIPKSLKLICQKSSKNANYIFRTTKNMNTNQIEKIKKNLCANCFVKLEQEVLCLDLLKRHLHSI